MLIEIRKKLAVTLCILHSTLRDATHHTRNVTQRICNAGNIFHFKVSKSDIK